MKVLNELHLVFKGWIFKAHAWPEHAQGIINKIFVLAPILMIIMHTENVELPLVP